MSQNNELKNMMSNFIQMRSPSGSGSLPSNTIANPRGYLKAITTCSGVSYDGPTIPPTSSHLLKEVEREPEAVKDMVQTTSSRKYHTRPTSSFDYDVDPRVPLILRRTFLRTTRALIDVHGEELTLRVNDEAITFNVGHTSRYSYRYDDEGLIKRCDRVTCGSMASRKLLNDDPIPPPLAELHFEELKMIKSSIDDPPKLELKDLPSHLEYAFLEGTNKLPVIIAKNIKDKEKARLLKVLKSHKRAIAWKISDIKGIDPQFCTHKILIEDDFKMAVQHQRRVNLKIHEVIKKEVIKLLDAGLIYCISDSSWISPVHCVPKKGDTFRFLLTRKTKRRPPSLSLIGHLPIGVCLSAYVMLREKCHFMVKEGIVLGHKISKSGIEVDMAKVDVIGKLPHPTSVKGAENLATDHLSRLENPHQGDLEKKEINETFPLETFRMISFHGDSSTPWFTDIANYHAGNFVVKGMSS
ncbi:hypothetical protein Tco_0315664 [Tanacetum coccineum]